MQSEGQGYGLLPKRGTNTVELPKGKALCNYFPLQLIREIDEVYIFSIEMTPHLPLDQLVLRERVFAVLEPEIARMISKPVISGMEIYSCSEPKATEKAFESGEHRVFVKLKRVIRMKDNPKGLLIVLQKFIRNLLLKKGFNPFCQTRKYLNTKKKVQYYTVNVYDGFHVDFVKSEQLFFLRIDTAKKMVCSQTALDAIEQYYKMSRLQNREEKRRFIKEKMMGRTVMANYGSKRFYKIKDISFQSLENERIEENIPLAEYYEEKYGVEVQSLSQPLLVVANRKLQKSLKKCFLVPQLCYMVGMPEEMDQAKQKNIMMAIQMKPDESRAQAMMMMENLSEDVEEWNNLQKLGVSLMSKEMLSIDYKKLPKPELSLGNNLKVERGLQTLFNITGRPIYNGSSPLHCVILYFSRMEVNLLYETLLKNSKGIGVEVSFERFDMGQLSNSKAVTQIQVGVDQACKQFRPNMILLVLPNSLKIYYRKLKRLCLIQYKISSQFICESAFTQRHCTNIFGKLLLQMLAKRGNVLWVPKQSLKLPGNQKVMLIAYDTNKYSSNTIISTCCTGNEDYNVAFSRFGVCREIHEKSIELMEIMIKNAIDCIDFFKKRNETLPDQIIFLSRSGSISMAESKFKDKFVVPMMKELKEYYEEHEIRMTYILADNKGSSKFFLYENPQMKARNTEIGAVFDEVIVPSNEFLMITQSTSGISSVPIRFKIMSSDTRMPKEMLQELLFNQCFAYANYTGLVHAPAILQYARKCAKFLAQSPFEQKLPSHLELSPYYL